MPKRAVLGCVCVVAVALVGTGTLVVLNWDVVYKNVVEALDKQIAKTQETLFRLGEVMSIRADVKAQYGAEPDVSYDRVAGDRILSISFSNYQLPGRVTSQDHAREIAAFAIGRTTKYEQIDAVRVLFQTSSTRGVVEAASGSESHSFALDDLMPNRRQVKPVQPDVSAEE